VQASIKKFERSSKEWAEWIDLKKSLAKFQAERCKEMSDDKGSDDHTTSEVERKRKSEASPLEVLLQNFGRNWLEVTCRILSPICQKL